MKLIKSYAHEVVQCLPLKDEKYKCVRCGLKDDLKVLFSNEEKYRCTPHYETITSGWRGEIVEVSFGD